MLRIIPCGSLLEAAGAPVPGPAAGGAAPVCAVAFGSGCAAGSICAAVALRGTRDSPGCVFNKSSVVAGLLLPFAAMAGARCGTAATTVSGVLSELLPKLLPELLPKMLPELFPKLLLELLPKLLPELFPKLLPDLLPKPPNALAV